MKFAVNFSHPAAKLLREGRITFDYFKCPMWAGIPEEAGQDAPAFVHFPLRVGPGRGDAVSEEAGGPPDWGQVEGALASGTPMLNVHLEALASDFPDISPGAVDDVAADRLIESALADLAALTRRFGADRVIVENVYGNPKNLLASSSAAVIRAVVGGAKCGFLLDISHARLAAGQLGLDPRAYIAELPIHRIREIHVTGIQRLDETWLERVRSSGVPMEHPRNVFAQYAGKLIDHLPMTPADWEFFEWSLVQLKSAAWATPWAITFEYGGHSSLWAALTDEGVLLDQVPRLYRMVRGTEIGD